LNSLKHGLKETYGFFSVFQQAFHCKMSMFGGKILSKYSNSSVSKSITAAWNIKLIGFNPKIPFIQMIEKVIAEISRRKSAF
jgi:hypothetical protein